MYKATLTNTRYKPSPNHRTSRTLSFVASGNLLKEDSEILKYPILLTKDNSLRNMNSVIYNNTYGLTPKHLFH